MSGLIGNYDGTLTDYVNGGNKTACWAYMRDHKGKTLLWCVLYDVLGHSYGTECVVDDYGNIVAKRKSRSAQ